ncbi:MAG: aspartate-semialdehyde dehydrogenase [Bacillota bacterium]
MNYDIGIMGASGLVGQEIIKILAERDYPVKSLRLFASKRSAGREVSFQDEKIEIEELTTAKARECEIILSSMPGEISKKVIPEIAGPNTIVIDNSSAFRQEPAVPLIVPEVNRYALGENPEIIANPNCSTIQLMLVLKPLADKYGLAKVVVATYQSVSGSGQKALTGLKEESIAFLENNQHQSRHYSSPIAFNVLPAIDYFHEDGFSNEEVKMINESRKILGLGDLDINATCVRVPVFYGHAESCYLVLKDEFTINEVKKELAAAPGVSLYDNPLTGKYPEPIQTEATDQTLVGRVRQDRNDEQALNLFIAANNLRKGAALNAVQIAESVI